MLSALRSRLRGNLLVFCVANSLAFQLRNYHYLPKGQTLMSATESDASKIRQVSATTDTLFSTLRNLEGKTDTYIVYYSDWCPDCRAIPAVVSALEDEATRAGQPVNVVLCNVGDRDLWKSGSHPLKTGAPGLKGIPTLMKWGVRGSEESRLERGLYDGSALASGGDAGVKSVVSEYLVPTALYREYPATTGNLFGVLRSLLGKGDTFVVYYSDWCPDCRAVPGIVSALQDEASRTGRPVHVVMCNVGDRDLWKSGSHPLKTGAPGLKGIPTLMKWGVRRSEESRLERGLYDGSALASGGDAGVKEVVAAYLKH